MNAEELPVKALEAEGMDVVVCQNSAHHHAALR